MQSPIVALFGFVFLGLFTACFVGWTTIIVFWANRRPFCPSIHVRNVSAWGLLDILVALVFMLVLQIWAVQLGFALKIEDKAISLGQINSIQFHAWIQSFNLLAMLASTIWICIRCSVPPGHVGWSVWEMPRDVILGLVATILFTPLVYITMFLVSMGLEKDYSHPILEMVGKDIWLLAFAIWMAVGIAPITEEFLFRVLLQGYLESMASGKLCMRDVILGRADWDRWRFGQNDSEPTIACPQEPSVSSPSQPSLEVNPYAPREWIGEVHLGADHGADHSDSEASETCVLKEDTQRARTPWWPVLVSGTIFGFAHFEYGVSWIPLILLGFVLGWLYRITGTIWASLVVHILLNSISMGGLAVKILIGETT